jgi:hypothetical protein
MALLFIDGFEGYSSCTEMILCGSANTTRFNMLENTSATYVDLVTTPVRTSQVVAGNSRSLKVWNYGIGVSIPNLTEVIFGIGFYSNYSNPYNNNLVNIGGADPMGGSQGVVIAHNTGTGAIAAYTNSGGYTGTLLGTATGTYANYSWHYLEVRVKVGSSTGEVEIRVNGTQILNISSVNTATGSLTSYSVIGLTPGATTFYDDLYVLDKTGSTNNNFLGPVSVYTLMPTGAGSTTNLTAVGAGSNWQAVSEVAADTTTYVETSTTGNKDYYQFQSLPAGVTSVLGVATRSKCTTADNGGRKVRLNMKNGANIISSTLRNLSMGSWFYDLFLSETAPDGSAWTKAAVDATEAGPEAG